MVFALGLPSDYPLVLGVAAAAPLLTVWQGILVGKARKDSGITYPQMYATKEEEKTNSKARAYNCTQRAHQNTLENLTQFYATLFIAGIEYPRFAAATGLVWLAGRVAYTLGYTTGDPQKRMPGGIASSLALVASIGASLTTSYKLLTRSGFQLF